MKNARVAITAVLTLVLATALFYFAEHQISSTLLEASLRPEIRNALEESMNDQKQLRTLDPAKSDAYKRRFDDMHRLAARIDVLRLSRVELLRRYELVLAGVFAAVLALVVMVQWERRRREERRLAAIQSGLEALSRGDVHVVVGDTRRDVLGRISRMIEQTARVVTGQRRRIESLQHLFLVAGSGPTSCARDPHAGHRRTPRDRAPGDTGRRSADPHAIDSAKTSALEELDRLGRYTAEFSSFAKLPQPVLRPERIGDVVDEFCAAFAGAWPNLTLRCSFRRLHGQAPWPNPRRAGETVAKADEILR